MVGRTGDASPVSPAVVTPLIIPHIYKLGNRSSLSPTPTTMIDVVIVCTLCFLYKLT